MSTTAETTQAPAENQNEVQSEITLFAEPIFHIGSFTVTNSLINSWVAVLILAVLFILAGRKIRKIPRGIQNVFEFILETALKFADSVTHDRQKSIKFLPIALTLFSFILVNNWLGLIPGVGTIGFIETAEGHSIFVPLFRGATSDINTTFALALIAILATHLVGLKSLGPWKHFNKFLNLKTLLDIPKHFWKDKSVAFLNPIKVFVGLIEIIGEFSKIASLSFRLFGNIFAGEVLLASMMAIFAFFIPLPFIFMEILVGFIQALVFSILTLVFMTIQTEEGH